MLHIESAGIQYERYIANLLSENLYPQGEIYQNMLPLDRREDYLMQFVRIILLDEKPIGYFCLSGIDEPIEDLRLLRIGDKPFYDNNGKSGYEAYIYIKQACLEVKERGKGLGRSALGLLCKIYRDFNLISSVNERNLKSTRMQLSSGFVVVGGYSVEFPDEVLNMKVLIKKAGGAE